MQLKQWKYAITLKCWDDQPCKFNSPYSHEHLPQWDRACAQCVQLLSHIYHRLAPSPPNRTMWAFLHAPYKPLGHSCFCPAWRIHRTSPAQSSPRFDPWRHGASTEDSSVNPRCLVSPSCLLDRLYRICVCNWAPLADWEYVHKLDRKGHPLDEHVWWPFFVTGLWWEGRIRGPSYFSGRLPQLDLRNKCWYLSTQRHIPCYAVLCWECTSRVLK